MSQSTKSSSRTKSSKAQKGSVGFIHAGTFRQGLFRVFKSDDKDPAETLNELHEYYGTKLSGRYVNVENVDELYEKLVESYQDNLVKGTTNVFKTSTMKSVSDNLKKLGEVTKCHLIKGDSDGEEHEEREEEHEEEPEEKVTKGKGSKGKQPLKKAEVKDETDDEDEKPVKSKQAKGKPSSKKVAKKEESEAEEHESESEAESESEDEKPTKKSKAKSKNDDSEDEGEKLKKKSSAPKKSSSSAKKTK
jgi:hypothetical protein